MGHSRRRAATFARLGAAALTLVAAVAALRASPASPPALQQAPPPAAQQAPPSGQQQPVFRAGVRLVRVDVSVTGKGDKPVADLTRADFEVEEDGVPQTVEQL
ncbi:MAG TPA: hypothetical protein VLN08_07775, partial [Vicinamibacterales bacterium]|nr:hypothetical protein [Vicinamibacterales bacterium]